MANFNPNGDFKDKEEWCAIAENKAAKTGVSIKVITGILLGGVGVTMGVELLAGVVVAGFAKWAWDSLDLAGKRLSVVRDLGCVAAVLDEDHFRTYVRQFGEEAVIKELHRAIESGCEISTFGNSWLKLMGENPKVLQSVNKEVKALNVTSPKPTDESSNTVRTRLETAIKLPAVETKTKTETWNPFAKSEIDIVKEAASEIKNLFIVGLGGSGKDVLLSCLLREVKQTRPDFKIFLVNGKDDPKERGYFEGVVDLQRKLNCETSTPAAVAEWFEKAIDEYDKYAVENDGALLVIDEGTIIGAHLKTAKSTRLGDKLLGITACGGSTNKYVWFVAQTPFTGANGSTITAISQLTTLAIFHSSNLGVIDTWKTAATIKNINTEEIGKLIERSECERAVYFGKAAKWYSMPKLVNHSGYDRDNQKYLVERQPQDETNKQDSIKAEINEEGKTLEVESNLSPEAKTILRWLQSNRKNQWVKFRGAKGRDGSFRLLLAENKMNSDMRDDALSELIDAEKIEMSADEQSIKLL